MNRLIKYTYVYVILLTTMALYSCSKESGSLKWDATKKGEHRTLTVGEIPVKYTAYEKLIYVSRNADTTYQYLNIYVPNNLREENPPIFLRTYCGGYMASKAKGPSANDATGYALSEGYVVCIAGNRGWNSSINGTYNGRAPEPILDLKAAVRYLHYNDSIIPGDANRIIADGTSAGGALVALLGASANHSDYDLPLKIMGAADSSDEIWAAVSYCPITNLENSDMAYEWQFCAINESRELSERQLLLSGQLASQFPGYLVTQGVTEAQMDFWIRKHILNAAKKAYDEGQTISPKTGISLADTTIDMTALLHYVAEAQPLKTTPAFDAYNVANKHATFENKLFGSVQNKDQNFTEFAAHNQLEGNYELGDDIKWRVRIMNPMNYICKKNLKCKHWYIRYGTLDRDTSYPISILLKHKLFISGADVNFAFQWDEPHNGDYRLNELFEWLSKLTR